MTEVKNQGNANTCWAFAAIGAIESSLIKGGFADDSIDLSEAHLGWFGINAGISDINDTTYGDGISVTNPYQYSASDLYVIWAIARGSGLELEEFAPYEKDNINSSFIRENQRYVSEYTVTEVNIFNRTEKEKIKKAIVNNGALMASYFDFSSFYTRGYQGYSFYENIKTTSNHATLIVGWDDNYSKDNFGNNKPSSDGAWLCRNTRGDSWGDNGYFWMSYETTSLKRIVSFKAEPAFDDIYQIYQYDGFGFDTKLTYGNSGVIYSSNVFDATENGVLEKIAFYTQAPDLNQEISIYSLNKNYTSPTDGNLLLKFEKTTKEEGYYLFDLPQKININGNNSFSIVIKTMGEGKIYVYSEGTKDRTSVPGKSFLSADFTTWDDTVEQNFGNLCIKAWIKPQIYESPNMEELLNLMIPVSSEYYEDTKLSSLINEAKNIIKTDVSERKELNNYLRLLCLYEKYYGYITIENEEQFLTFVELVNNGNNFTDKVIVLENDLDFSLIEYTMPENFNGIFNGKNFTIEGIDFYNSYGSSLFGVLGKQSIIKNVIIKESSFRADIYAGSISYYNQGKIIDCSTSAVVLANDKYGIISGLNTGVIENCAAMNPSFTNEGITLCSDDSSGFVNNCLVTNVSTKSNNQIQDKVYSCTFENNTLCLNGIDVSSSFIKTYMKHYKINIESSEQRLKTGDKFENITVILKGDVDGNGILTSSDYLRIKMYFINLFVLNDSELKAADIDNNGQITSTDYLMIKSHFIGNINIYGD